MSNALVTDLLLGSTNDSLLTLNDDEYLSFILNRPTVSKDFESGSVYRIQSIFPNGDDKITITTMENGELMVQLRKEKEYLKLLDCSIEDFMSAVNGEDVQLSLPTHVMTVKYGSAIEGTLMGAHIHALKEQMLKEAEHAETIYYAKVLERNKGGFLVNVLGLNGFLPGSLAAANRIIDFDLYLGTVIPVMVEDYLEDSDMFVFSNKKYIRTIIPTEIAKLDKNHMYSGVVTGTSKFGVFVEFNNVLTGLIHTSEMSKEHLDEFKKGKWKSGDKIDFWIKEITEDNRIILTFVDQTAMNQVYETIANYEAEMESSGQKPIYLGHIVSVKPNVVLVKIEDNVIGALADKDFKKVKNGPLKVSDELRVKIEKIDIDKRRMTFNIVANQ